ncbi:hypothetical protein FHS18_002702 [Paenibacillus phyllosphaerae]|uniref:Uncharacterized protein n=1 Tax=Paenibacillus phyllosphaerae TaxID=274593 RepID=A0A7W5FMV7_9BACL|nr:mechanosensitive ion channel protein MscL [Paenibacillus phyllosphaerae]MBB3110635.1 hypothetical protein [Paenibacillus phyllosphaerae]
MIVFDVIVEGAVKETLKPAKQQLKEIAAFMKSESVRLIRTYGSEVQIKRRMLYK